MERNSPVRRSHASTADLLSWPENPHLDSSPDPAMSASRQTSRVRQPSDGISKVLFGGQVTDEEAESLLRRKPCSGSKLREMTGSGIFVTEDENGGADSVTVMFTPNSKTGLRLYQQAVNGISQISFSIDESISPKKPVTLTEVAKQRELSGTLEVDTEIKIKKQLSEAKSKELSGHDIFGPPTQPFEIKDSMDSRETALGQHPCGPSNFIFGEEPVIKTAKKIYNQKFSELTGTNIFKDEAPPGSAEKPLSEAKLKEISGSDIFAEGKTEFKDYLGGIRKPPGGESSIALV